MTGSNDRTPGPDAPTTPLGSDARTTPLGAEPRTTPVAHAQAGLADTGYALQPGDRVGDFSVVAPLGRGGMGEVYLAEQIEPVQRRVALKLIQGKVASPLAVVYFEIERQALAQMQHPAIAQVFDAGTTAEGTPYFAMELVEGTRLDEFAREERLDLAQRLALFARVCRGVHHAHQKGILHRDLKPGNVLVTRVDGEPQPKIIDFGIAVGARSAFKSRDPSMSERAGTPPYMSPEQAAGAGGLDTRTDVYSLGVILFELLTGSSALAVTGASQAGLYPTLAITIAASEAPEPVAPADPAGSASRAMLDAAQRLPSELRHVLAKAVSPDRERRYDSAAALADDLNLFLHQRPVGAVPRTRRYVWLKFVERNRGMIAAAALGLVALFGGAALATYGFVQAERERVVAEAAASRARIEAAKSARIADFVRQILAGVDPDRARSMDRALLHHLLENAAANATKELASEPQVLAAIEETIGMSYRALGEYPPAEKSFRTAYDQLASSTDRAAALRLDYRLAEIAAEQGRNAEALERAKLNLQARSVALGPQHVETFESLSLIGSIERDLGKFDDAERHYKEVVEGARALLGPDDPVTLDGMRGLAIVYADTDRPGPAEELLRQVYEKRRMRQGEEHSNTLSVRNSLAVNYLEQKRFADAEALLAPMLPIVERVFGPEHPRTITTVSNLAGALRQQGKLAESGPLYERAYALTRKVYGAAHPAAIIATHNLGNYYREAGRLPDAVAKQREAEAAANKAFGADHPVRLAILDGLGEALTDAREFAEAEKVLSTAYDAFKAKLGADNPRTRDTAAHLAKLMRAAGRPAEAARWDALAPQPPDPKASP